MNRSHELLNRSLNLLYRSLNLIDRSHDLLNRSHNLVNCSLNLLNCSHDLLNRSLYLTDRSHDLIVLCAHVLSRAPYTLVCRIPLTKNSGGLWGCGRGGNCRKLYSVVGKIYNPISQGFQPLNHTLSC